MGGDRFAVAPENVVAQGDRVLGAVLLDFLGLAKREGTIHVLAIDAFKQMADIDHAVDGLVHVRVQRLRLRANANGGFRFADCEEHLVAGRGDAVAGIGCLGQQVVGIENDRDHGHIVHDDFLCLMIQFGPFGLIGAGLGFLDELVIFSIAVMAVIGAGISQEQVEE